MTGIMSPKLTERMLRELQETIGAINQEHGFHQLQEITDTYIEGVLARNPPITGDPEPDLSIVDAIRRIQGMYFIEKLDLIHSEASEALEELRKGHLANEIYYVHDNEYTGTHDDSDAFPQHCACGGKPKGVPPEIADIVIRCFDLADEAGFDLGEVIQMIVARNANRPFKHGKVM